MTPPGSGTVTVGPAAAGDVGAIAGLDGLGDASRRLVSHDIDRADRRCLVARVDGRVVGFGAVMVGAGEAHLLDLAVAVDHRRRGIGTHLVVALRRAAHAELGATAMTLEVRRGNAAARALYRAHGFVEAGVRPGYYPFGGPGGGREDAVIMWDHDLVPTAPPPS